MKDTATPTVRPTTAPANGKRAEVAIRHHDLRIDRYLDFRKPAASQAARFTQFFSVSISFRSSLGSADMGLIVAFNIARRSTCTI